MSPDSPSSLWLAFTFLTVVSWGLYGVFLHTGQMSMGDPVNGRYKAFLFVGVAYFLIAVLAPLAILLLAGANWSLFTTKGITWSLIAGIVGAIGALGVLLAFANKGTPAAVMAIVFAGAPIVNAIIGIAMHPPADGWGAIRWQFVAGILLAAIGGCLVTWYKPGPGKPKAVTAASAPAAAPEPIAPR